MQCHIVLCYSAERTHGIAVWPQWRVAEQSWEWTRMRVYYFHAQKWTAVMTCNFHAQVVVKEGCSFAALGSCSGMHCSVMHAALIP